MADVFDLEKFVRAQNPVYSTVVAELRRGRKDSHWMWFVFPQIKGLGFSATAQKFALSSRAEAEAYLAHPTLGSRLRESTGLVNAIEGRTVEDIFGYPDNLKFRSSMTLFAAVTEEPLFQAALDKYFAGVPDAATLKLLAR